MRTRLLPIIISLFLLTACNMQEPPANDVPPADTPPAETGTTSIPTMTEEEVAENVLAAINTRNTQALASFVHPEKGVFFSPYAYVNIGMQIVFLPEDFGGALEDTQKYTWGEWDGVGGPIELTFEEYLKKFVWDHDFSQAPDVLWGAPQQRGNTMNNIAQIYPDAHIVEYHFPSFDPQYEGMDWSSLYLALEQYEDKWKLVGIVHDQWTI